MKIYGGVEKLKYFQLYSSVGVSAIITNPFGLAQFGEGKLGLSQIVRKICNNTSLPIWVQVHGLSTKSIVEQAHMVKKISPKQVNIKIMSTSIGFEAIKDLKKDKIDCIATGIFSLGQALAAATVGAYGICPFITKGLEFGLDSFNILTSICNAYQNMGIKTEVIAASITAAWQIERAAICGATAVALRWPVLKNLIENPFTKDLELVFKEQWNLIPGENINS